jgi:3-dehydroquinate dehydratase/shikimate dehydrogenase
MPWQPLKLCVSLLPESLQDLYQLSHGTEAADLIELRLDILGKIPFEEVLTKLRKPLIVTVREPEEGGFWKGTEQEKNEIFISAIKAGVQYLDIEWQKASQILNQISFGNKTQLILSHHTDKRDLEQLDGILNRMLVTPAQVYKLIYRATSLNDCINIFTLIKLAGNSGKEFVIHAIGEEGQNSRLLGALAGNSWTYVSHPDFTATADGQIDLKTARNTYFLHEKSRHSKIVGLIGYPINQSSGWKLHNRLLHELLNEHPKKSDDFLYMNFPAEDFSAFWKEWKGYINGLSITIPHKQAIVPHLKHKGKSVELSGVCNTAIKKDKYWYGFNTDFLAIFELLNESSSFLGDTVMVYGTGATTRSAIAALKELNRKEIYLSGRNLQKGKEIADEFGVKFKALTQLKEIPFSGIIQTTPVGMFPRTDEIPPLVDFLKPGMLVFDVIYNPATTRFLHQAMDVGCRVISGEMMYLHQAYWQFELFSGTRISLEMIEKIWREF